MVHSQSFGKSIALACGAFAITDIDDMAVLVTFFSESTTSKLMTPWRIVLGQYIGFTFIIGISLIGFAASYVIPTEPIGFMGFVPLLLGIWRGLGQLPIFREQEEEDDVSTFAKIKTLSKVALITLMNGGDNVGTYVPLFAQSPHGDIVIYVVTFYVLVGVWCLVAYSVMRQKHVVILARKYVRMFLPFLYHGLGLYIIINSDAYPWFIQKINHKIRTHPGKIIMGVVTTFVLLIIIASMVRLKFVRRSKLRSASPSEPPADDGSSPHETTSENPQPPCARLKVHLPLNHRCTLLNSCVVHLLFTTFTDFYWHFYISHHIHPSRHPSPIAYPASYLFVLKL